MTYDQQINLELLTWTNWKKPTLGSKVEWNRFCLCCWLVKESDSYSFHQKINFEENWTAESTLCYESKKLIQHTWITTMVPDNSHCPSVQRGISGHSSERSTLNHDQSTMNWCHTSPVNNWFPQLQDIRAINALKTRRKPTRIKQQVVMCEIFAKKLFDSFSSMTWWQKHDKWRW